MDRYPTAKELARDLRVLRRTLEDPSAIGAGLRWHAERPSAPAVHTPPRLRATALILTAATLYLVVVAGRSREMPAITSIG